MSQASPNQPPSGGEQPLNAEALFAQAATAFVQTVSDVLDQTPLFPGDPDTRTPKDPLPGATPGRNY